jgi:hypothetical protein
VEGPSAISADADLDAEVDRFDRFSFGLVQLEPHPLGELHRAVERFTGEVANHLARSHAERIPSTLAQEHDRFRDSILELRSLLAVVEREDHGGHRQALGQYGRIFAEAMRRHRADERSFFAVGEARPPSGRPGKR